MGILSAIGGGVNKIIATKWYSRIRSLLFWNLLCKPIVKLKMFLINESYT